MGQAIFVISKNGERLMPTSRAGRVRHLLKDGKAKIIKHKPFTIQLTYETPDRVQPLELCVDTGYQHIGVSLKSENREYVSAQYDLLKDEKEHHDDARKFRRSRRNHLRYRKARFDNRRRNKGWLAPSLQNKADRHVDLIEQFCANAPITRVVLEMGQFDTQVLQAVQEGKPIPEGIDYQHGERYGVATIREAVFQRDGYKCRFCGRSAIKDNAILHVHHAYFWRGQHGDRLSELASACEKCHTPESHKPGGKLYGYDKPLPRYTGAAFMNSVKWYIYNQVKGFVDDVRITYGAATKLVRIELGLEKSHANDAFSMGEFHPERRVPFEMYVKCRRNNRILEKFYDAKYIDSRDGCKKSGAQLGCQRTNRREPRMSDKNLRIYHDAKVKSGQRRIRKQRYEIQPGDVILFEGERYISAGIQNKGAYVSVAERTPIAVKKCRIASHCGGWQLVPS